MTRKEEFDQKVARIRELMNEKGWEAVVLGRQSNFSWLGCGAEAHVALTSVDAVARFVILKEAVAVLTNKIEAPRLLEEEVGELGVEVIADEWFEKPRVVEEWTGLGRVASDLGTGILDADSVLRPLRMELNEAEVERYREVGRIAEEALRTAAKAVQKGESEGVIAGRLAGETYARGATPAVNLIAADDRITKHRHPIPKDARANRCAMLVLCARKYGLIVSCTRLVHFGPIPDDLRRRHDSVAYIDAVFNLGTRPGRTYGEVFADAAEAYRNKGFDGEWKLHHQGGPTGYNGREFKATLDSKEPVQQSHVVAWNPSITGTKSEDTVLITEEGPEVLSAAQDWPMVECEVDGKRMQRPDILVL